MDTIVGVIGPLEVQVAGQRWELPRERERHVIALLALAHPAPLGAGELAARLSEDRPVSEQTVRSYISRIRGRLGEDVIESRSGGYVLRAGIDAERLDTLVADAGVARRAGDVEQAMLLAREALRLWRGTPYGELGCTAAEDERQRLTQVRRRAVSTLGDALVDLGRAAEACELLAEEGPAAPLDEALWASWMRALHAAGRRDRALEVHDRLRRTLSSELGLDPGDAVQALLARMLEGVSSQRAPGSSRPSRAPKIAYAEREGRSICYVVHGSSGPPLLFLHGMNTPAEMMFEEPTIAAFLDRLGAGRRLILMDMGGVGLSDPLPADQMEPWTWAGDIAAVMDRLALETCPVVSHVFGSMTVLALAAEQPQRVSRLVLSNLPAAGYLLRGADVEATVGTDVVPQRGSARIIPSRADDEDFLAWLDRSGERGASPGTALAILRNFMMTDARPVAERCTVPAMYLIREHAWPGLDHGKIVVDHLPDGRLEVLPGADAAPFGEGWEAWVDAARAFVDDPVATPDQLRLRLVAVSRSPADATVVTVHDRPDEAVAVLEARLAESPGSCGVLHAGLAGSWPRPHGPAVEAAHAALVDHRDGVLRTGAFSAITRV